MSDRIILFDTHERMKKHVAGFYPRGVFQLHYAAAHVAYVTDEFGYKTYFKVKPNLKEIQGYACPIILVGYSNFSTELLEEVAFRNMVYL